ncbi:MAG: hypothetical protein KGL95_02850 [Patescibacteria group bacterium]|nr:hypothetical protein [Patescibacteria group bacterium]
MLFTILAILIILWVLGYVQFPIGIIPNITLFILNGVAISLWNILTFLVIIALIGMLPRPFREIAAILFTLWVLSVLGIFSIFAFALLPAIILGALIIGLMGYMFRFR